MKILLIDTFGNGLDWAHRCQVAGHDVRWYYAPVAENVSPRVGEGFGLKKVTQWKPWMDWADLIVMTGNSKLVEQFEPYQKKGYPIFGPNVAATRLEQDREFGLNLLTKLGVKNVPFKMFTKLSDAETYILANKDKVFVVKPSGDTGVDRAMSHVSKSQEDLLYTLADWEKKKILPKTFLLQEKIKGIEVGVGGWFGPGGWCSYWEENFEFKPVMPGDLGPNCDEQGTVMRYTKKSKLADTLLEPLTDYLHSINYVGNIDVNAIVDETGTPLPLEFTCRLGDPAFMLQQRIHKGDPAEWMLDLIEGRDTLKASMKTAVCVVMSQPDYPYNTKPVKDAEGIPMFGLEKVWDKVHPKELQVGEVTLGTKGKWKGYLTAGTVPVVASALGNTIREAKENCEKTLKAIEMPNSPMWRNDIGVALAEELPALQKFGFCEGMKYE